MQDYEYLYKSLANQLKQLGRVIPCSIGGTFENHPPDAIVAAAVQRMADIETQALGYEQKVKAAIAALEP